MSLTTKELKVVEGSIRLAIVANGREKARIDAEVEENYIEKCKKVPSPLFHHENGIGTALALQCHIWHAFWKVAESGSDARKHVGARWRPMEGDKLRNFYRNIEISTFELKFLYTYQCFRMLSLDELGVVFYALSNELNFHWA